MDRRVDILLLAAPGCALVAAIFLAFWPSYSDGRSLAEVNGSAIYLLLAGIAAFTALPGKVSGEHRPGAALIIGAGLVVFSFISVIGVFFLPAAACLLLAAWLAPGRRAD